MTLYWKMKLWREEQKTHNPILAMQLWKEEQKTQDPIWAMKMLREKQKPMTLYETMKLWREEQETQKAVKGRTETHVPLKEKESHGPIIKWIALYAIHNNHGIDGQRTIVSYKGRKKRGKMITR